MTLLLVRIFTVLLELMAAILSLKLIRITRRRVVWIFISSAIMLTALERSLTYYKLLFDLEDIPQISLVVEYIAFYIAILMLFGIGGLHALFSEINRSHALVQKSEKKYRTLLENLPQCIYLKDPEQVYVACNENFAADVGLPTDSIAGKTDFDLFGADTAERKRAEDQRVIDAGELDERDIELEREGGKIYQHAVKTPLRDEENGRAGLLVIYWDVTAQRQAENRRREIEEKMRQPQKLEGLGVLAGGIAHDFNNLLTGILGNTYLMQHELPPDSDLRGSIRAIESAAGRAAELTAQMLAYSGQGQYALKRVELAAELAGFEDLIRASISKRALLEIDLGKDMPFIEIDPNQLQQIVINLTTNASEAIGDANGIIRIAAGVRHFEREVLRKSQVNIEDLQPGDYAFIKISDTGCGFDERDVGRLFEPFYTTKFTGRGLGLAAVLGIVRSRGGGIFVSSEPGHGSSFTIILPQAERRTDMVEEALIADALVPELRGSGTVLVVDDERVVREVARRLIEIAGFTVLTAASGPEAIELYKFKGSEIDAVLLDMTMPLMSGREVFKELRAIDSAARIILSSGYNEHEVLPRFLDEDFVDFVEKPYNFAKLYRVVMDAVGQAVAE
jgi:two-component system, cell cycle sensor histidine kinase and response regulator CckA